MATKSDVLDIKVNGLTEIEKATKSTSSFKKELAEAKKAALEIGDPESIKKLAALQDKLDDVNDSAKSLRGSGVEGLTSSFGLLKDGIGNADFGKLSAAFKGIGAAMAALPIFFLIEGVKLLIENFDEIVKFFGVGVTESDRLTNALNEQKKANEGLSTTISNQIKLLSAQGGNEEKILELKQKLIAIKIKEAEADIEIQKQKIKEIILNDSLVESLKKTEAQRQRLLGNSIVADLIEKGIEKDKQARIKEASDLLKADFQAIQNLRTEDQINEITTQKDKEKDYKQHLDKLKEIRKKYEDEISANRIAGAQIDKDNKNLILSEDEKERKEKERIALQLSQEEYDALVEKRKKEKLTADDAIKLKQYEEDQKFNLTKQGLQAASDLSSLFFTLQLNKSKGNAARELEIRKNQFIVEKAFKVAQITMDGIQGGMKAYAMNPLPSPIGVISASLQGLAAAVAVGKVLATQFNSGSASSSSDASLPVANTNIPNITPNQNQTQPATTFNGNNNTNFQPTTVKAVVVETEMTNSQQRVEKLTRQSLVG
jgi:hypothetical protein